MTHYHADAPAPRPSMPLLSWLLPGAAMIAAVVGLALVAAAFGPSRPAGGEAAPTPDMPSLGSITGAPPPNGERPFAYLEFDWDHAAGVPGFGRWQEPARLVINASNE